MTGLASEEGRCLEGTEKEKDSRQTIVDAMRGARGDGIGFGSGGGVWRELRKVWFGAKRQSGARSLDRGSDSRQRHLRALRDLRR